MPQSHKVLYSISLEDATPRKPGVKIARGAHFEKTHTLTSSNRPPLQHVISWIDSQAPAIRASINKMLKNPGTDIVHLHARFPIRTTKTGRYIQHIIPGITVDGLEIDRLKGQVIEIYDASTTATR
jgi:hypothetical protein